MADFKSWQEVEDYLSIDSNVVNTLDLAFTGGYMCCSQPGCCDWEFVDIKDCIRYMKETIDLDSLEKCE